MHCANGSGRSWADLPESHPSAAGMHVRPATASDADAIVRIYNEGIRGRRATFETVERTVGDIAEWQAAEMLARYPLLVATVDGVVCGWIRASSYRARACYADIGEFSVYVATDAHGRGIGSTLMTAFLPACADAGLRKVLSRIFPENTSSLALCARHGFRTVGTYEHHGQLDGVWRDVVIVERLLTAEGAIDARGQG